MNNLKLLFACVLMLIATAKSSAQNPDSLIVPYFSIISPGHLTQQYDAALSQFGQASFGPGLLNGDVVATAAVVNEDQNGSTLLCDPTIQDFTGKIVLIPRGECEFGLKALHAQQQGAVGVIIQNFEESTTLQMGAGASGSMVNIPVIMCPKSVGDAIRVAVSQGETVVVGFTSAPYNFGKIKGKITGDLNSDCAPSADEPGLGNWLVTAEGADQTYSVRTRSDGTYSLYADSTNSPYSVTAIPLNDLWQICQPATVVVDISGGGDTVTLNYTADPTLICPQLSVEIGTPFLRRCFENWFKVKVCNYGSMAAEDAYVTIHLETPGFEPIQNSNLPFSLDPNGDYRFELGTMDIGECANIQFSAVVTCDNIINGQILCYTAHAYPDTFCILPNPNWNGANVSVTGICNGPTQKFLLKNIGTAPMSQSSKYIVVRNGIQYQSGQFQFGIGESQEITVPADGATWRVEATQVQHHPTPENPAATLEGCTDNGSFDTGFALQFSVYDPSEAVDNECQEVIGSWDPNDKQGFPLGITDEHLILPNTKLDYLIRFQNTGTDTAFNIVVRDTLSQFFALESVRPGVASAAYDFEIVNGNVLVFRFKDIKLVDSFANEAASHGFVQFSVDQKPNLDWGTIVQNAAAIYFDFNPPVITNTTLHQIGDVPHPTAVNDVLIANTSTIMVFPNPAQPLSELSLSKDLPNGAAWKLMATTGKVLDTGVLQGNRLKITNTTLGSGIYWIEFSLGGRWLGVAKWVVK